MEWFYAHNQQQKGPVSSEDLERLLQMREINLDTLVWKQGMPQWQSYRFARSGNVAAGRDFCAECGRDFPLEDLIQYDKFHVCAGCKPIFFQRVREGAALPSQGGVWRSDKTVVMTREALLPDRCVKCNASANGYRLKRKLRWHNPFLYILIISPVIYIIVALIVSKTAEIQVGLCEAHRKRRRNVMILATALFIGWPLGLILGAVLSSGALVGISFLLLIASLLVAASGPRVVTAEKIEDRHIRFRGSGRPFLESIPEWQ